MSVYKVTALEDMRYKLMSSFPPEGFLVKEGNFIYVDSKVLKLLTWRRANGKGRGKIEIELQKGD